MKHTLIICVLLGAASCSPKLGEDCTDERHYMAALYSPANARIMAETGGDNAKMSTRAAEYALTLKDTCDQATFEKMARIYADESKPDADIPRAKQEGAKFK